MFGISKWFKTAKAADTIVDGVVKGVDALVFTEEEKAELAQKAQTMWLEGLKVDASSSAIRSVTRRFIAILTFLHYFIWIDAALVAYAFGKKDFAMYTYDIVVEVFWLVFAVASYYYGPAVVERAVAVFKGKK